MGFANVRAGTRVLILVLVLVLLQGFKEKQPDKIVPVDVLQGFGSLLDMVTKIVERAEDKSGAGAHESLRNLAKVSEDEEHEGMLNLEGEAAGDEAGEDGAEQESTKRWRNLEMDKLVDEALAALIALMDVLGRNRWDKLATARPSLIPSLCTHFTRAGIEWRR